MIFNLIGLALSILLFVVCVAKLIDLLRKPTALDIKTEPNQSFNSQASQKPDNKPNNTGLSKSIGKFDNEINNKG